MAILQDFEANRGEVLDRLRRSYTPAYFALLLRLLDRQLQAESPAFDEYSDDELAHTVCLARSVLNEAADPRTALIELESALVNRVSAEPAAQGGPYLR